VIELGEFRVRLIQQLFIVGIVRVVFLPQESVPQAIYGCRACYEILAKRALARGEYPEVLNSTHRRLRSDDKADPDYYARHMVTKAQSELQQKTAASRPDDNRSDDHARGTP
jgi:hypothetical protein